MVAAATFEDTFRDEDPYRKAAREDAMRFIQDNWQAIDQAAMWIDVNEDLEDLGNI